MTASNVLTRSLSLPAKLLQAVVIPLHAMFQAVVNSLHAMFQAVVNPLHVSTS